MRRILVDRARHKATRKRGANAQRLDLDQIEAVVNERLQQLLLLDEALRELDATTRRRLSSSSSASSQG
jgi:hypothetical protein